MAAAPPRFRIDALQEDSHDGHCMIYGETLDNFARNLPQKLERWFEFTCPVQNTSFMFKVTLRRAANDGGVDCEIIVRRNDDHPVVVTGDFWICACTTMAGVFDPRRTVQLPRMPPNSRGILRTVPGFISKDILTRLGNRPILFHASLGIHGCHRERDTMSVEERSYPAPVPQLPKKLWMLSKM